MAMTRILYVFPHPDDESFGPSLAICRQLREGDEVHLLTLTRGGATKQRHRLGLTIEEMGKLRHREMLCVEKELGLSSMRVLDLPDGGLGELDPPVIEAVVADHIGRVRPEVLVTYPVHGISGFADHLVTHAVVKQIFCDMREATFAPRRLAFFTLLPSDVPDGAISLQTSRPDLVDCEIEVDEQDVAKAERALACYESYQEIVDAQQPLLRTGRTVYFEIFGEDHAPRLKSLREGL